jgi:hypothetical protein
MRRRRGEERRRRGLEAGWWLFLGVGRVLPEAGGAAGVWPAEDATDNTASRRTRIVLRRNCTVFHYLALKICAHDGTVVLGKAADQFLIEIFGAGCDGGAETLLIGGLALVDVFLQAIV